MLAFYGLTDPVRDVDFSPDGDHIAAISKDGMTKVWSRTLSSAAALLPKGVVAPEPVVVKPADNQKHPSPAPPSPPAWRTVLQQAGITPRSVNQLPDGTWDVNLANTTITDLTILKGAPISKLQLEGTAVSDLTPLRDMPLKRLRIQATKVTDLSPLQGMPLEVLFLMNTGVSDLTTLRGMPLTHLLLYGCTKITDLSPLAESKTLTKLGLPPNVKDLEFLRAFPKLERLGVALDGANPIQTTVEFWKDYDAKKP